MSQETTTSARDLSLALLDQVKAAAVQAGLTDTTLGEKAGFMRTGISRMLSGRIIPRLDNFVKLCHAAGLEITVKKIEQ